ncbi:MAG: NAD(P)-dependent alcohol dehydrogenase [Saprospirales bacterium]|nr:NAD(P)-dependent alcohol dehydrogenase [Saprospirales bacterium]
MILKVLQRPQAAIYKMKAIVIRHFGSKEVLEPAEMPDPEPDEDELLVRIHAIGINPFDWKVRKGLVRRVLHKKLPIILGQDFSGEVISVGSQVGDYEIGDRVFGTVNAMKGEGSYAELIAAPAKNVATLPANMSFEEAAALPTAGLAALQALRDKGNIRNGMDVLINGAAGGVGHYAIQIAKFFGAYVTAVCGPENLDFATDLGADEALDYTKVDYTKLKSRYDIIFDVIGNRNFRESVPVLQPKGVFITTKPTFRNYLQMLLTRFTGKKSRNLLMDINEDDLWELKKMAEAEQIRSHVGGLFPFEQAGEAQALSESAHLRGKIVLQVLS